MKNKVTRDLQHSERISDDKIKQFRNYMTELNDSSSARNEATFELIQEKQKRMDAKLAEVEVTEVVLDYVNAEVRKSKKEFGELMTISSQTMEDKFRELMEKELTNEQGLFGKDNEEEEKTYTHQTLKEYMVAQFEQLDSTMTDQKEAHDKLLAETAGKFSTVNKKVN